MFARNFLDCLKLLKGQDPTQKLGTVRSSIEVKGLALLANAIKNLGTNTLAYFTLKSGT